MVSVLIPNWNGARLLPACLDSLRTQTHPDFEVVVVDNGSSDGSAALVREGYPEVKLLQLPRNLGLTGACNRGLEAARGDLIALLNNDAQAHPAWLTEAERALSAHSEAGMAASKMLFLERPDTLNSAGDLYRVDGTADSRGVWERDEGQYEQEGFVFGACGGAALYRRAMLEEIGFFDEDFFMYCEDVDLAWRAQLAGYRCIYAPQAIVYHRLSATGGGKFASFLVGRNAIFVIAKNYPAPLLRKHWPRVLAAQARISWQALRAFRGEAARARIRGQLAGLAGLPLMLAKRRKVQGIRRVSDEYLESILAR